MASQVRCQVEVKNLQIPPQQVQVSLHLLVRAQVPQRVQYHQDQT